MKGRLLSTKRLPFFAAEDKSDFWSSETPRFRLIFPMISKNVFELWP